MDSDYPIGIFKCQLTMNKKIRLGGIYLPACILHNVWTKYGEPMMYGNIETGLIENPSCSQIMEMRSRSGRVNLVTN
jgi:hypothetical protein